MEFAVSTGEITIKVGILRLPGRFLIPELSNARQELWRVFDASPGSAVIQGDKRNLRFEDEMSAAIFAVQSALA